MDLKDNFLNKTVFITGASSDIGISIARSFYNLGGDLTLSDHPDFTAKLESLKAELESDKLGDIKIAPLDLTKKIDNIAPGKVDVLINCAGRNVFVPFNEVTEEIWDSIIDVNLKGTFFLTQLISKRMIEQKVEGRIINIGSQHGVVANGLRAPYCISKFGTVGMTKVMALELSPYNILVNCVSPTFVETEKSREFLSHKNVQRSYLAKIPLGKYANPSDISSMILYLASSYNRIITGENILIDGGYTIH